jgi:hypothetical protein
MNVGTDKKAKSDLIIPSSLKQHMSEYGVKYKNNLMCVMDYKTAISNGLMRNDIKKLKSIYRKIYRLMDKIESEKNTDKKIELAGQITKAEFELQHFWGFDHDAKYHKFWFQIPGCECPYMDNMDRLGTGTRVINENCIFHGQKLAEITK